MLLISVIFMLAFPLRRVAGVAALGGLRISHGQQQFQNDLLAPHQDEKSKVGDVVTQTMSWMTFEPLFRGFSQQDLSRQSLVGHSEHMAEPIYL